MSVATHGPDDLSGHDVRRPIEAGLVALHSPVTGMSRTASVNRLIAGDTLVLHRYTKNWRAPDDRKVNPWDLNEPDPTDAGTMGTIPGPTIECDVGDTLQVHFRNADMRMTPAAPWDRSAKLLQEAKRTHSLHAHGVSFPTKYDGAYPLSPPDRDQPIEPSERPFWDGIGVTGPYKQCDRVPPAASFTYVWQARGAASAGVWIYHDHSICHENTALGALGLIVVHNPADKLNEVDITADRLPGGSWVGSPLIRKSVPVKSETIGIADQVLEYLGLAHGQTKDTPKPALRFGNVVIEVTDDLSWVKSVSLGMYRQPPDQAQYLLIFHELQGVGMCINGRQYLGNTPTLVAGAQTRMRFGVAGMGEAFHTFHIHGHRWVVPGPSGKTPAAIEQSAQTEPTSSFEDTRIFGPGSSFAFTLEEGTGLFRADPPFGEWHMHCHVPMHMMGGMAGSLLVIKGGELAMPLPEGVACPPDPVLPPAPPEETPRAPQTFDVHITNEAFIPSHVFILPGDSVRWINDGSRAHGPQSSDGSFTGNALSPPRQSRSFSKNLVPISINASMRTTSTTQANSQSVFSSALNQSGPWAEAVAVRPPRRAPHLLAAQPCMTFRSAHPVSRPATSQLKRVTVFAGRTTTRLRIPPPATTTAGALRH